MCGCLCVAVANAQSYLCLDSRRVYHTGRHGGVQSSLAFSGPASTSCTPPRHVCSEFISWIMFCDVCRKIGLSHDGQAAPMLPQQVQTHHQTYASLRKSASLQCFVCMRLWEALTPDEQASLIEAIHKVDNRSAHNLSCGEGDKEGRNSVTVARLVEEEPEYYLWHPGDRLLQIGFNPVAELSVNKQPFWRVSLYLTDSKLRAALRLNIL
jgi:hypothetical protein